MVEGILPIQIGIVLLAKLTSNGAGFVSCEVYFQQTIDLHFYIKHSDLDGCAPNCTECSQGMSRYHISMRFTSCWSKSNQIVVLAEHVQHKASLAAHQCTKLP